MKTFVAVLVFAAFLVGCAIAPVRPGVARMAPEQAATAVLVEIDCAIDMFTLPDTVCGRGSGTMIDSRRVLTAYHVVRAPGRVAVVHVVTADLRRRRVVVVREWRAQDLAILELASADSFGAVSPPILARAATGEAVCSATAEPRREFHCGRIEAYDGYGNSPLPKIPETNYGDASVMMLVVPGNSGAAVYDGRGRLVGVDVEGDSVGHGRIRVVDPWVLP